MPFNPAVPGFGASATIGALPGVVNNNAGGVGSSIQSSGVISTIYDLDPFAIMQNVFSRHDQRPESVFRIMLEMFGMGRGVSAPTTGHYEEDRRDNLVKIGSVFSGSGAGATVVLALHADSMFSYPTAQTASGVTQLASSPAPGEIMLLNGGVKVRILSKNTSVNPHRISVQPLKATQDASTAVTAAASYAVLTNAWGEGTGLPDGKLPRIWKYTNVFQIVKAAYGFTGTSATDVLFAKFDRQDDGSIAGVLNLRAMDRFEKFVSNALLFGSTITNTIVELNASTGLDHQVKGTEGMIEAATTMGHIPVYTTGNYSLDDYDNISTIMTEEGVGTNTLMQLMGNNIFLQIENLFFNYTLQNPAPLLKGYADNMGVNLDSWTPFEDENFGFYVGFKSVHKGGYNFTFKMMPEFVNPTIGNTAQTNFNSTVITAPIGQTKDAQSGQPAMKWWYEWRVNPNGYSRRASFGNYAGVGAADFKDFGPAVNDLDVARAGMLAEVALHVACCNQIVYQEPGS